MKISTEIMSAARIVGEEKAVELIAKAGFDAWDFSMFPMWIVDWKTLAVTPSEHPLAGPDYLNFARRLKQIGLDNGIICNQSHAPFPSVKDNVMSNDQVRSFLLRAIECTAEAGGEICIIHPDNNKNHEENKEMYMTLLPFAKEHNVKVATENMWNWDHQQNHASFAACATPESFNAHLDAINDEYFTACLDIGHAEMRGVGTSAVEMIKALGKRLGALHIHDNDQCHDTHQIPFSMKINFGDIVEALKSIEYQGYLTLEADAYLKAYNDDNVFEGILNLQKSALKLANMF